MKKIIFSILVVIAVGFSTNHFTSDKATATVNQVQGLFLFVDSRSLKPLLKMISKAAKSRAVMYFHILQSNYPKPAETILFVKSRG